MRIFVCASKHMYGKLPPVIAALESRGHVVTLPNSYYDPLKEEVMKTVGAVDHALWKGEMLRAQKVKVAANDAVLVMNFEKNGVPNYIGGATFLEVYMAFDLGKPVYLWNPLPDGSLQDELRGMRVQVIDGDL
ncbi:MAG: hypothetical protein Q7R96_02050, partial [Nanoarchaeota archaeon]|nr:hypothetical protein [Nanoarchaeota archaeon]